MVINTDPGRRDLLLFGALLPFFFGLVGVVLGDRTGSAFAARVVWMFGIVVTLVYLGLPRMRRPIFVGWAYVTYPIAWAVSNILLVLIYSLVISPIGLLLRLLRRDPLARELDRSADSYWVRRERRSEPRRYFDQF